MRQVQVEDEDPSREQPENTIHSTRALRIAGGSRFALSAGMFAGIDSRERRR